MCVFSSYSFWTSSSLDVPAGVTQEEGHTGFFIHLLSAVVVVVVVDSHIQRIVLATEETTVTQQVSPRPIKCQSRLWSQRGTKVNGSHHGDNPLLRPTGIQIATKSYAALQAMAPTNIKTVHQTSLLHIESNLDRLGMLSPTHDQRSQQKMRALIFLARRIQPLFSLVDREVEYYQRFNRSPPVGHFYFCFLGF